MKPTLMLHEVDDRIFSLPLEDYILTFDDGLFSQYMLLDELIKINTQKIFFISTNIIAPVDLKQTTEYVKCDEAHQRYREYNDLSCYMNWNQIKRIYNTPGCFIGGHSHNHNRSNFKNMFEDTRQMIDQLNCNNIDTDMFCYPYNEYTEVYRRILVEFGFKKFYGKERVDVNLLLNECR